MPDRGSALIKASATWPRPGRAQTPLNSRGPEHVPEWLVEVGTGLSHGKTPLPRAAVGEARCMATRSWLCPSVVSGARPGAATQTRRGCAKRGGTARFGRQQPRGLPHHMPEPPKRCHGIASAQQTLGKRNSRRESRFCLKCLADVSPTLKKINRKNRFARGFRRRQVAWIPDPAGTQKVITKQEICPG